jgi:hypothetical protein
MGAAARTHVLARHSWSSVARSYVALLEKSGVPASRGLAETRE